MNAAYEPAAPSVLVLLATHNGAEFLQEQLDSVLAQQGVNVTIVVSDDASADSTDSVLRDFTQEPRVRLLESGVFGSAAKNFFRLIRDVDAAGFDAIALCDQDDIWESWKLQRHFDILSTPTGLDGRGGYAAVSSNVTAFGPDGRMSQVVKNQTQRSADFVFESGGPGSTFLLRPDVYAFLRTELSDPSSPASQTRSHDWLIYALVRATGHRWFIDGESSVRYRQHTENALGANEGIRQNLRRLRQIVRHEYRADVMRVLEACAAVGSSSPQTRLHWLQERFERLSWLDRLRVARQSTHLRRRRRDQLVLAVTLVTALW